MIYADKKAGVPTGRWRVELQRGKERYRARFDSYDAAVADDKRVKSHWTSKEGAPATAKSLPAPEVPTLASVADGAQGTLWDGISTEATAWAHVKLVSKLIGPTLPIDQVETPHLTAAIKGLLKLGKAKGTVNRHMSHFRTFLIWAQDEGLRKVPVAALKFRWQQEPQGRLRWFTKAEEAKLKKFLPRNVWLLTKVAIETGCRRDELLFCERSQINGNLLHLWVTKTKYPRTVPMDQETTAMLTELIDKGTMPTKRGLRSAWDRVKVKMGLQDDKQFCFHTARHTCATRLVEQGENVLVIKEWLGHKRIETTQRYAHVKPSNLQDALLRRGTSSFSGAQASQISVNTDGPPPSPFGGGIGPDEASIAA